MQCRLGVPAGNRPAVACVLLPGPEQLDYLSHNGNEGYGEPNEVLWAGGQCQFLPGSKLRRELLFLHLRDRPGGGPAQDSPDERADDRELDGSGKHGYTSLRLLKAENAAERVRPTRARAVLRETIGAVSFWLDRSAPCAILLK